MYRLYKVSSLSEQLAVCLVVLYSYIYFLLYCDFCSLWKDLPVISHTHTHTHTPSPAAPHLCVVGKLSHCWRWRWVMSLAGDEDVGADTENCALTGRRWTWAWTAFQPRRFSCCLHFNKPSCNNDGLAIFSIFYFKSILQTTVVFL